MPIEAKHHLAQEESQPRTEGTAISPEKNELPPARFELATLGLGSTRFGKPKSPKTP
jgi:hypothetical protein